ncbi:MAG TPA: TadE family protein [Gemmatimonadaceae bacterium]|nr:TadE family protein [Gemmatimonadaceae bacterium]
MRLARFVRRTHGTAMVEFAIVLPLLLMLVFGIIDFGRAFFLMNNLTSAVREGGRYGATIFPDPTAAAAQDAIKARVVAYIQTFGGADDDPTVTVTGTSGSGTLQSITVTIVDYPFTPITPLAGMVGLGTISMSPSAVFRWEGASSPPIP